MVRSKSQRRLEILHKLDNVASGLRELGENFSYLDAAVKAGIWHHYIKGQLALILNLNIRSERDDVGRTCTCWSAKSLKCFTAVILHNNAVDSGYRRQGEQNQMLVRNVEFVKSVEDGAVLPSFVRLYVGDEQVEDGRIREGVYANPIDRTFKVFQRGMDRKLRMIAVKSVNMLSEQSNPSEIERGPKIVNSISSDQGDVIGVLAEVEKVYEFLIASVSIHQNSGGAGFFQRANSPLQIRNVLIGPLDFQASFSERIGHGAEVYGKAVG